MRIFLWTLMLTAIVSADEAVYAIQVLNVKAKEAVTPAFVTKAKAVPMLYRKKHIDGRYKVFLGEFKTHEEAVSNLTLVREQVNKDAFVVRMEDEYVLDPKQKMQQAMLMAQARTLEKMKKEEVKIVTKELETVEPIKVPKSEKKIIVVKHDTKSVVGMKEDAKTEKIYCKPSKKVLRESEISDALAFYRKSSYYNFTN